jgi:hypothetical protein
VLLTARDPANPKQMVQLVFDPFRQLFENPANTPSDPSRWAGLPPTRAEVRPGADGGDAWLEDRIKKPCIKDLSEQVIFEAK